MRFKYFATALSTFLLVACGSSGPNSDAVGSSAAALTTLPATLEGELALFGGGNDGHSDFHLGTLTVGADDISIKVNFSIVDAAGIVPPGEGKVRTTLGSKTDFLGEPVYTVTSLQKL